MKKDITAVKKSYAEITNSEVGIENDIVIRNYEADARESTDPQTTLNMVNTLIRDGLKFTDINVVKCERKQSRGQKPGVIIATIANRDQKQKVMDNKKKLRHVHPFKKVYVEDARPLSSTINESHMMTVLHELGKKDQYFVSGNGRILRKTGQTGIQRNRDRR